MKITFRRCIIKCSKGQCLWNVREGSWTSEKLVGKQSKRKSQLILQGNFKLGCPLTVFSSQSEVDRPDLIRHWMQAVFGRRLACPSQVAHFSRSDSRRLLRSEGCLPASLQEAKAISCTFLKGLQHCTGSKAIHPI